MKSINGQRLSGLIMLLISVGATAWSWYTVLNEGHYYRYAVAFFPACAVLGFGLIVFPMDGDRLRAEHGVEMPTSFAHYPLSWKVLIVVAVIAALGNWFAISQM